MSGQEEQHQPVEERHHDENIERFVDLMVLASVAPPPRGPSLLDYLYFHGVPISVSPFQSAGGAANNLNDIESAVASILSRSLYDRHPVKKVITEEARCEIVDKKFTAAMVEELKINGVCGIWQEEFEDGEHIKILPCNHAFKADAIMKWLEEEKAECPVCRFSLKSKEVNENQNMNLDDDDGDGDGDGEAIVHEPEVGAAAAAAAEQDNDIIRVNNIASRMADSVAGRINHPSVSMPMNQLLQSIRMMSSSSRSREPMRAAVPSAGGAAAAPNSYSAYANAGHEVRAEAIQRAANPPANNNNNNNNNYNNYNNNYNIINNYYYDNNNNNNYSDDEDVVLNQEQADIEEAIRRSLEQI